MRSGAHSATVRLVAALIISAGASGAAASDVACVSIAGTSPRQKAEPSLLQRTLACDWSSDIGFVSTLGYPGSPFQANGRYNTTAITTWLTPQAQDPLYMKQSWVVVMAYMLSHYDYLHE